MPLKPEKLSDERLEEIINSKMVQKYLAYEELASGINALKDDDVMFDQLLEGIESKVHVKKSTVETVRNAFVSEVETNTTALEQSGGEPLKN